MIDAKRRANVLLAAVIFAAVAFLVPAASPAHAAGLINCVPLSLTDRSGACWESVWVNGVERRMGCFRKRPKNSRARYTATEWATST